MDSQSIRHPLDSTKDFWQCEKEDSGGSFHLWSLHREGQIKPEIEWHTYRRDWSGF